MLLESIIIKVSVKSPSPAFSEISHMCSNSCHCMDTSQYFFQYRASLHYSLQLHVLDMSFPLSMQLISNDSQLNILSFSLLFNIDCEAPDWTKGFYFFWYPFNLISFHWPSGGSWNCWIIIYVSQLPKSFYQAHNRQIDERESNC